MKNHVRLLDDGLKVWIFGVQQDWGILVVGHSGLYSFVLINDCRGTRGSLCIVPGFDSSELGRLLLLFSFLLGLSCLSPLLDDFS